MVLADPRVCPQVDRGDPLMSEEHVELPRAGLKHAG
jgi:hypothetical protein